MWLNTMSRLDVKPMEVKENSFPEEYESHIH